MEKGKKSGARTANEEFFFWRGGGGGDSALNYTLMVVRLTELHPNDL